MTIDLHIRSSSTARARPAWQLARDVAHYVLPRDRSAVLSGWSNGYIVFWGLVIPVTHTINSLACSRQEEMVWGVSNMKSFIAALRLGQFR